MNFDRKNRLLGVLAKQHQRENDLLAKASLYELEVEDNDLDLSRLEQEIIEREDKIADLVAEARFCSIAYSYDTDREELQKQIKQAIADDRMYRSQLRGDYYNSRL